MRRRKPCISGSSRDNIFIGTISSEFQKIDWHVSFSKESLFSGLCASVVKFPNIIFRKIFLNTSKTLDGSCIAIFNHSVDYIRRDLKSTVLQHVFLKVFWSPGKHDSGLILVQVLNTMVKNGFHNFFTLILKSS